MQENKIALFEEKEIRRVWYNEDWYFSVEDVVQILTDSVDVKQYIKKLKAREPELNNNWGTICTLVEMIAKDGKKRKVDYRDGIKSTYYHMPYESWNSHFVSTFNQD